MTDTQGFDPALLSEGECHERTQLYQLGLGEMPVQLLPQRVVGNTGVPDDGAGIGQCYLLLVAKAFRILKVQQLVVLVFG
ncbi:MAG: hypothetical protein ACR2JC_20420 [Chloroflexota bacterium]|nr:MAG: hypothetical protein DLM70_13245 [Chloroflexota bacterium]